MSTHDQAPDQENEDEGRVYLACVGATQPRFFTDDMLTCCAVCGAAIYHRPGALADLGPGARAACLSCAARYAEQHSAAGAEVTAGITRAALDEAVAYLASRRR